MIRTMIYHFYQKMKTKKCNKVVCNLYDKNNYVVQEIIFKKALNCGLMSKNVHKKIQFIQKAWLRLYIDMNTKLKTEAKNDFERDFFKLMNNAVFRKTMKNVKNHWDGQLVRTKKRRNLVSEPNYHTRK